jgi:hypothetical protein
MFTYRHRPEEFVSKVLKLNISLTWIFMLINQIPNRLSFDNMSEVYVFTVDDVELLLEQFISHEKLKEQDAKKQ